MIDNKSDLRRVLPSSSIFSVLMGEKYTVDEASTDKLADRVPFPEDAARVLAFDLSIPIPK